MKKILSVLLLFTLFLTSNGEAQPSRLDSLHLSITTYNLLSRKFAFKGVWEKRREQVGSLILREGHRPDILACQECQDSVQLGDMVNMLKGEYDCAIFDARSSARAIFWRRALFRARRQYSLDMMPKTNPSKYQVSRYANCVELNSLQDTSLVLTVCDIHLKTGHTDAIRHLRRLCIEELCKQTTDIAPLIVLGDFNSYVEEPLDSKYSFVELFEQHGFLETFRAARTRTNAGYRSYFTPECMEAGIATKCPAGTLRIDYILLYPANRFKVENDAMWLDFMPQSDTLLHKPVPSDHNPVNASIILKTK